MIMVNLIIVTVLMMVITYDGVNDGDNDYDGGGDYDGDGREVYGYDDVNYGGGDSNYGGGDSTNDNDW